MQSGGMEPVLMWSIVWHIQIRLPRCRPPRAGYSRVHCCLRQYASPLRCPMAMFACLMHSSRWSGTLEMGLHGRGAPTQKSTLVIGGHRIDSGSLHGQHDNGSPVFLNGVFLNSSEMWALQVSPVHLERECSCAHARPRRSHSEPKIW